MRHLMLRAPTWLLFLLWGPLLYLTAWGLRPDSGRALLSRETSAAAMGLVMLVCMVTILGWLWAVGRAMNAALPASRQWRTWWVDIAAGYTVAYICVFVPAMVVLVAWPGVPRIVLYLATFLGPFHLLAMLLMALLDVWVLRAIVVQRCGRFRVGFGLVTLALLGFYPVGIWFVHSWARAAAKHPAGASSE